VTARDRTMHEPGHFTRAKSVRSVRFLSTLPPSMLTPYRFTPSTGLPITLRWSRDGRTGSAHRAPQQHLRPAQTVARGDVVDSTSGRRIRGAHEVMSTFMPKFTIRSAQRSPLVRAPPNSSVRPASPDANDYEYKRNGTVNRVGRRPRRLEETGAPRKGTYARRAETFFVQRHGPCPLLRRCAFRLFDLKKIRCIGRLDFPGSENCS
jgi:hypothetical protein